MKLPQKWLKLHRRKERNSVLCLLFFGCFWPKTQLKMGIFGDFWAFLGDEKAKTSIFGEIAPKFGWKMGILCVKWGFLGAKCGFLGFFGVEKGKMVILGGMGPKIGWKMGILG